MATAADLAKQLAKLESTYRNPTDVYNESLTRLGVPDVRTRVTGLRDQLTNTENLLKGVEGSVTGRTSGSLVTEAQRGRLVNMERAPIAEQLGTFGRQYETENANLSDLLGQAKGETDLYESGFTNRRQGLSQMLSSALEIEAAAERKRQFDTEQARLKAEAAAQRAASAASRSSGGGRRSSGRSSTSKAAKAPSYGFKNGKSGAGGFWFTDASGKPISAATYARLTGQNLAQLVAKMANAGDAGAAAALRGPGLDSRAASYRALTWT